MTTILAIESSCDDTSVAVLRAKGGDEIPQLLSLSVQSQWEVHERYGGVVPELASRAHLRNLLPCLEKALQEANISLSYVNVFAATSHPGLVGCLLIGHTAAKTLASLYQKPLISCHHIEAHLMSVYLEQSPIFPYLSLVVSGGHTSLYRINSWDDFEPLGFALDDAAGEAFDKGAKLLGLNLPGGPELEKLAQKGDPRRYSFGTVQTPKFQFSFSGLKSELVRLKAREGNKWSRADVAASYQKALLDHLIEKLDRALEKTQVKSVALVGGVAANQELRRRLGELKGQQGLNEIYFPSSKYCTDNAAMVGVLAYRLFKRGEVSNLSSDVRGTTRNSLKKAS